MQRTPQEIQNELIVIRAQEGNAEALRALVKYWQPKLLRHATYATKNEQVAKDIVQDAWLVIVRTLKKLEDPTAFRAWAFRIVRNKSVDWIRKESTTRKSVREIARQTTTSSSPNNEDPDSVDEILALRVAIRNLTTDQQQLLHLFYHEQIPVRELAEIFAVPQGTIKHRLYRVRQLIKQQLKSTEDDR